MTTALAAQELVTRRQTGRTGERLDIGLRPKDNQQALAIQSAVTALLCDNEKDSIGAWKAGMPAAKQGSQPERIVIAPIFVRSIQTSSTVSMFAAPTAAVARVEPEFALVLARDLPPRKRPYSAVEVRAAIGGVHLALELVGGRYTNPADCNFADKLADSLENQGLFVGPAVDRELAFKSQELIFKLTDKSGTHTLKGKHPTGDPLAPLYWLAEFLRARGEGLLAGQKIITGCYTDKVLELPFDQPISLTYITAEKEIELGKIEVQFRAR